MIVPPKPRQRLTDREVTLAYVLYVSNSTSLPLGVHTGR